MSTQSDLAELYTAFFNRAPDSAGLAYWVNQLNAGTISLNQIAKNWVESQPEGQAKYPAGMTTTDFVNAIYGNVLSRTSDTDGLAYWKAQLDAGTISRDTFVATVINGAKSNTSAQGKADAALLSNKATVGIAFADKGLNDTTLAAKVLTSVNADSNSLNATLDLIKLVPSSAAGQTTAVLNSLGTALGNVATLIKTSPAELGNLVTYLNAVLTGVTSNTNLDTLFTSINTKVVAAQTNPSALADAANQGANDASIATPTEGGGGNTTPPSTPTFTVTNGTGNDVGKFTVGTANGDVKITLVNDKVVFTPTTGSPVSVDFTSITKGLVIDGTATVSASDLGTLISAPVFDFTLFVNVLVAPVVHQITGNGTIALTGSLPISAGLLNTLNSNVTPKLNVTAFAGEISGSQVDLLTALNSTGITGLAAKAVTIADPVSIAAIKAVDDKTTGAVTANVISDTAEHLAANVGGYVKAGVAVNFTDTVTVAQVNAVAALTHVTPTYQTVTDTIANLTADVNSPNSVTIGHAVQVTDVLSLAQLAYLSATDVTTIDYGTVGDTVPALTNPDNAQAVLGKALEIVGTASVADILAVLAAAGPDGGVIYTTVTDSVANLTLPANANVVAFHDAAITGTVSLQDIADVRDAVEEGSVTYGTISDTVAHLTDPANLQTIHGHALSVSDALSVQQVLALHAATNQSVTYTNVSDTYAHLAANSALLVNKIVTVTDDSISLSQLSTVMQSGATSISYGGVSDTYANLSNPLDALLLGFHAVSITDPVSASQVASIQGINNIGTVTSANLADSAANLDAASSDALGTAVKVTFNDTATIAQLTNVDGKTAGTLVYTSVTDSAVNLAANLGGYVKNAVNVTVSDTASMTQLAAIDLDTTGTLTATNIADDAAALAANVGGYVKAGVNVTLTDAATLAQVKSIDDANGTGTLTATNVIDTAALLAANLGGYVKAGVNVTVNDTATVAQLNTIDGLNGNGILFYAAISDTAGTLVTNAGNYVTGSVNVTVSDAATLAQLSTIDLKTTGTLTANLVQDSVAALTANADGYVKAGVSVTVTDAATIAQLTSLDGVNGTGSVTATTITDSAANLFTNAGGYVKGAVNVSVSDAATIEQLTAIDNANGAGTLTYTALSDTSSNLLANITGTGTHYVISGKNVTVTDAVSLQTLASIDTANGAGTLTADSVIDAADKLLADTTYLSPTTHVEIQGTVSLADLKTIDDKSGVVIYNNIADDVDALVADTNSDIGGSVNVTVNDAASIADLTAIHIKTTGTLTYTSITDSADHLAADAASLTGFITGAVAVEVTGAISLSDLYAVDQKTTGTLTYSSISDTAANVVADAHHYINSGVAVTVSGVIALSDLVTLAGKSASVAYTEVTGTAAALATDALSNAGDGTFVTTGKVIDVTDAATVQQLADIKAATGLNAHFTNLSDTGAALAGGAAAVGLATTVTVTDAASLSDLAAINGHLSLNGELVYTAVKDTATNLVDNVGGYVNGSVNVTVSDAATVASLAAISAMTTGTVTAEDLADTHQNLFSPQGVLTSYVGSGSTVTVNGDATIAELKALVDRTGDATKVHYTSISDSLANLMSTDAAAFIKSGINVSIDSTANATVAQLAALDAANGAGTLTYSGVTDTAANLAADAVSVGTKYTANQSVVVTDAATVQQLNAINGVADNVSYDKVTDTAAHLFADAGDFVVNGVTVTVSDAATIAQLASIDSHTDVALVYTKVTDSAANLLLDNGTYVNGSVAVTLTDTGSVAASTLKTIDTETTTQVDASSVATLTGDYSSINSVLSSTGVKLSGSEALILNDTAADLAGKTLHATTSTHDVLNVGLASVTTNLSGLTGFEDIFLAGSNRSTNAITIGDGDGVSVHAAAASTVILGSGQQSFFTSTGNDTVTVNAGSTFVFAASAAANGVDLVKNFAVGSNGSALDFSNFLGLFSSVGTEIVSDTSDSGGAANTVTLLDGNSVGLTTKNAISVADFDKNFLSTVNGKEVFVAFDNTAHSANVYFVNSAGGGSASVVDNAADITLVGTVSYTGSITSVSDLHLSSHLLPL